jgi:HTH-type transcriptional regulator / antitoxin HigA
VTHAKSRREQNRRRVVSLADTVFVPHTEAEYERLVSLLDRLVDEVGEDESHPLASLMEIVGVLIEKYEDEHVPELSSE